jgi:hypothetical protein
MKHRWLLALLCLPWPALAANGVLEINQDCVASGCFAGDTAGFPVTINAGGGYRLTSNLSWPVDAVVGASSAIVIGGGQRVDLDLGGFVIQGLGTFTGTPVTACTAGGGSHGIQANGTPVRIHHGAIRGTHGLCLIVSDAGAGTVIEELSLSECNTGGDWVGGLYVSMTDGVAAVLRNVRVSRSQFAGIMLPSRAVLSGMTVEGNSTAGLRANGDYTTVTDSTFAWNGWHGITTDGYGYPLALGRSSFINNNLSAAEEYSILGLLDMGGNVCAQTCQ